MLRETLADYEAGTVADLAEPERASIVENIRQRIADLDATIEQYQD
jgi:hypothetical protein